MTRKSARELGVRKVNLDTLFGESRVISNHAPITPETKGLVGARQLQQIKPGAIFVNTARARVRWQSINRPRDPTHNLGWQPPQLVGPRINLIGLQHFIDNAHPRSLTNVPELLL